MNNGGPDEVRVREPVADDQVRLGSAAHPVVSRCTFSTNRLDVGEWHEVALRHELDLELVVAAMLTPATTVALPPAWQGRYPVERATRWVAERDAESPTFLVSECKTDAPVGLVILFEDCSGRDGTSDLRLGYLFAESAWGVGYATELVEGLVSWARGQAGVRSISGGVAAGNLASARVLAKNGFSPVGGASGGEQVYGLSFPSSEVADAR